MLVESKSGHCWTPKNTLCTTVLPASSLSASAPTTTTTTQIFTLFSIFALNTYIIGVCWIEIPHFEVVRIVQHNGKYLECGTNNKLALHHNNALSLYLEHNIEGWYKPNPPLQIGVFGSTAVLKCPSVDNQNNTLDPLPLCLARCIGTTLTKNTLAVYNLGSAFCTEQRYRFFLAFCSVPPPRHVLTNWRLSDNPWVRLGING